MRKVPWAPEGWLFLIPVLILTALALLLQYTVAAIVLGLLALFLINFFRDPRRTGSEHHVDVLSPADGTVVAIKDVPDGDIWPGLTKQVSIFMSVFDVHVNRAPITRQDHSLPLQPGEEDRRVRGEIVDGERAESDRRRGHAWREAGVQADRRPAGAAHRLRQERGR